MIDTDVHFVDVFISEHWYLCMGKKENDGKREERERAKTREVFIRKRKKERRGHIYQLYYQSVKKMARAKLLSLSRIWYTIIVVLIHLILVYFGIKQCYYNDRLFWPKTISSSKIELLIEKFCLLISLLLLFIFIYPSLFHIGNYSNDNEKITLNHLEETKNLSLYSKLWKYSFALSSTLHLIMSFLIIISTVLIHAKQITIGLKDSGEFSSSSSIKKNIFLSF
jgi:hypothetical protein